MADVTPKNDDEREALRLADDVARLVAGGNVGHEVLRQVLDRISDAVKTDIADADPVAFEPVSSVVLPDDGVVALPDDHAPVNRVAEPEAVVSEDGLTAIPFGELYMLSRGEISPDRMLSDHVDSMVRMGIVEAGKADDYRKKFDTIYVNPEVIERGVPKGYTPMLFIDDATPVEAMNRFILKPGLSIDNSSDGIGDFFKVDAKRERLPNQAPSGKARLIFVLDNELMLRSLDYDKKEPWLVLRDDIGVDKKQFLSPAQWLHLFVMKFEAAIRQSGLLPAGRNWKDLSVDDRNRIMFNSGYSHMLLDVFTCAMFPDHLNSRGNILTMKCNEHFRSIFVSAFTSYSSPKSRKMNARPYPTIG